MEVSVRAYKERCPGVYKPLKMVVLHPIHTVILYLHTNPAIWAYQISETEQGSTLSKLEAKS